MLFIRNNLFKVFLIITFIITSNKLSYAENLKLSNLIKESIENNPEISEIKNRIKILELKKLQTTNLDDPMFAINAMNLPMNKSAFGNSMMQSLSLSISQKTVFFEKLNLETKLEELNIKSEFLKLQEKTNELKKELKKSYYEIIFLTKSIEVLEKNKKLLKELRKISESYYVSGQGLKQDIIKADVEISKLNKKITEIEKEKNQAMFMLNHVLFRSHSHDSMTFNSNIKITELNLEADKLENEALALNPAIKMSQIEVEMNDIEKEKIKLSYIPDFDFMLSYGIQPDRADLLSGGVSFNLPVWYKDKQKNQEKEVQILSEIKKQAESIKKNEIGLNVRSLIEKAKSEEKLYKTISKGLIIQAQEYTKAALVSYQAGESDFMTLLDSYMNLFDYELDSFMNLVEHEKTLAELEFEIGKDLKVYE
jgi:cobalt-zinc-cadmium efflux system outer membrane protein